MVQLLNQQFGSIKFVVQIVELGGCAQILVELYPREEVVQDHDHGSQGKRSGLEVGGGFLR